MKRVREEDERALRRIVALLFALAQVAERAGAMSFPARLLFLAILRHVEIVAWAFACGLASAPAQGRKVVQLQYLDTAGLFVPSDIAAVEAARLALGLRVLALFIAGCANRILPPGGRREIVDRVVVIANARPPQGWRSVGAPFAPDTS
ncbi:hypothetical protein GRZ55_08040 [Chelativorans sp. ZYF759]|uniref:hypothetical protein n=1 Tax=Chelativorans sp. ZYF759 TaxID=2692213 RepID=UPI00145DA65B|nr:hypothetical protein [Chelativorans sp. ZYF759]NMG39188.1 hypothetical protein [Chelativorans sp. ZYF759]